LRRAAAVRFRAKRFPLWHKNMAHKTIFAIDSSGAVLTAALSHKGKIFKTVRAGVKQEEYLFPCIERLLKPRGLELRDIKRVCVVTGPGRFTGLRIGISFANVLKALSGAEVAGVTAFEAVARQVMASAAFSGWLEKNPGGVLAVVLHAFRDEYYCQLFRRGKAFGGQLWFARETAEEYLLSLGKPGYCAGWAENGAPLSPVFRLKNWFVAPKAERLRPETLLELGAEKKPEALLRPIYLKPARYELEWGKVCIK